jgi:Transposase DDE domain
LDKPFSVKIGFVRHQWSGKHHRTVKGIGLITLVWTNGNVVLLINFRIYNIDEDNKTKNDHFLDMIDKAQKRGFKPKYVMFDIWYASIKNLKAIRKKQCHFVTRLKSNRLVNPDNTKNIHVEKLRYLQKELLFISEAVLKLISFLFEDFILPSLFIIL